MQPGTVVVLRNLSVLSSMDSLYVNITLANVIALFWLSLSAAKGSDSTTRTHPGIFTKRMCRVTKADILRDAKLIEEETRAEGLAEQASIHQVLAQQNLAETDTSYNTAGRLTSPAYSTDSSVPSSIRAPTYNQRHPNPQANMHSRGAPYRNPTSTPRYRPNFRPGLSSTPAPNSALRTNNYPPPNPVRPTFSHPPPLTRLRSASENFDNSPAVPSSTSAGPGRPTSACDEANFHTAKSTVQYQKDANIVSKSECQSGQQFRFKQNVGLTEKENKGCLRTDSVRSMFSADSDELLEGVDEDSMFGDF